MAQFSRLEVAQVMKDTGMVPLFFHNDIEVSKKVLKACYDGGARLMEFTARGDFAHEVFGALSKYDLPALPGLILGVGSVPDAASASLLSLLLISEPTRPSWLSSAVFCLQKKKNTHTHPS